MKNVDIKEIVSKKQIFLICSIIFIAIYIFLFNKCKYCNIKHTKNQPASVFIEIGMFFKQIKYSGKSVVKQEGILLLIGYDCGWTGATRSIKSHTYKRNARHSSARGGRSACASTRPFRAQCQRMG